MGGKSPGFLECEVTSLPSTRGGFTPPIQPNETAPTAAPPADCSQRFNLCSTAMAPDSQNMNSLGEKLAVESPCPNGPHKIIAMATGKSPTKSCLSPISPIGTPQKSLHNIKHYIEEIGHLTTLDVRYTWLPFTECRQGNALYAAFHNLNASIGYQTIFLPFAFVFLGWTWGLAVLITAFAWQMYTRWMLIMLHESEPGKRHRSYVELSQEAFGQKIGFHLSLPPVLNLTVGTAIGLIVVGGSCLELFYVTAVCHKCDENPLSMIQWCFVFSVLCLILAQLPNMNSIAGVSLVGAVMAFSYITLLWVLSISKPRPPGISYSTKQGKTALGTTFSVLNAIGVIAFSFRGHNLALEIQGTLPTTLKEPASVPMWKGAKAAYVIVALCYFPLALGGYGAFGNQMMEAGILYSLVYSEMSKVSRAFLGLTFVFMMFNCLSMFQIYSMPVFDMVEQCYTARKGRKCDPYVRFVFRSLYVFLCFFVAIAFPFLTSLAGLIGGLNSIPVTFVLPCFMWLKITKPQRGSSSWYFNWFLGLLGLLLTIAVTAGGVWNTVNTRMKLEFFKPHAR